MQTGYVRWRQALSGACTRRADGLTQVVVAEGESNGVAKFFKRRELPYLAVWLPDDRLKLEDLKGRYGGTGGIGNASLCKPDDLAEIINAEGAGIVATGKVRKPRQFAISPNGPETLKVRSKTAKIFTIWIGVGDLRTNRRRSEEVWPVCAAVAFGAAWPVECAEVLQG